MQDAEVPPESFASPGRSIETKLAASCQQFGADAARSKHLGDDGVDRLVRREDEPSTPGSVVPFAGDTGAVGAQIQ